MKNPKIFIKAVLIVFALLVVSRIPSLINGNLNGVIVASTVVELVFFIWGMFVLLSNK